MNRINSLIRKLAGIAPKAARLAISSARGTHVMTSCRRLTFVAALTMAGSVFAQQQETPRPPAPTPTDCYFHPWHPGCHIWPMPGLLKDTGIPATAQTPPEPAISNQIASSIFSGTICRIIPALCRPVPGPTFPFPDLFAAGFTPGRLGVLPSDAKV